MSLTSPDVAVRHLPHVSADATSTHTRDVRELDTTAFKDVVVSLRLRRPRSDPVFLYTFTLLSIIACHTIAEILVLPVSSRAPSSSVRGGKTRNFAESDAAGCDQSLTIAA